MTLKVLSGRFPSPAEQAEKKRGEITTDNLVAGAIMHIRNRFLSDADREGIKRNLDKLFWWAKRGYRLRSIVHCSTADNAPSVWEHLLAHYYPSDSSPPKDLDETSFEDAMKALAEDSCSWSKMGRLTLSLEVKPPTGLLSFRGKI